MSERKEVGDVSSDGSIGILICDDVEGMRFLLGTIIQRHPGLCVVGEARDGLEAISEAERLQPDVILLDLSMPRLTGLEALPDITRLAPDSKVIVLSGFASSTVVADALARGAVRYVEKGVSPDTLTAIIEEVGRRNDGHGDAVKPLRSASRGQPSTRRS